MACPQRLVADQPAMATTINTIRHLKCVLVIEYIVPPPDFNCGAYATYRPHGLCRNGAANLKLAPVRLREKTFTCGQEPPRNLLKQQNPRADNREWAIVHVCHRHPLAHERLSLFR